MKTSNNNFLFFTNNEVCQYQTPNQGLLHDGLCISLKEARTRFNKI